MTTRRMIVLLAALGLALPACGADTTDAGGDARLRLVNATGSLDGADLLVDGRAIAQDVGARGMSETVAVSAGTHDVAIRRGGQTLESTRFALQDGVHYTVLLAGTSAGATMLVAGDTAAVPAPGMTKVRVVHAAPGAPAIDVYLTEAAAPLDGALRLMFPFTFGIASSGEFPGYVARDPGAWRVRFTAEGTQNVLADSGVLTLSAGEVVTVVVGDSGNGALEVSVVRER